MRAPAELPPRSFVACASSLLRLSRFRRQLGDVQQVHWRLFEDRLCVRVELALKLRNQTAF